MHFDEDFVLACQLQEQFNEEDIPSESLILEIPRSPPVRNKKVSWDIENKENISEKPQSIVDPSWEYIDPTPDIHAMFIQFNKRFFWETLDAVELKWSPRMTSCAGVCCYEGKGSLCSIRLSLPLLKLRPRKDLVETLLHEMIHAFLFVTDNDRDRDGHGPQFRRHMDRINKEAGTNITIYHTFHAEVELYQQHWWRCDGPCQNQRPFFGTVKRAMNRPPGPTDFWWAKHQATCGGKFIKVREPVGFNNKAKETSIKGTLFEVPTNYDIRRFFPTNGNSSNTSDGCKEQVGVTQKGDMSGKSKGGGLLAIKGGGSKVPASQGRNKYETETGVNGNTINSRSTNWVPSWYAPFNGKGQQPAWFTAFSGKGYTLSGDISHESTPNKLQSTVPELKVLETPSPTKRKGVVVKKDENSKRVKPVSSTLLDKWVTRGTDSSSLIQAVEREVACPSCGTLIAERLINDHLDSCLLTDSGNKEEKYNTPQESLEEDNLASHSSDVCCVDLSQKSDESSEYNNREQGSSNIVLCPVCNAEVTGEDLDRHLEACMAPVETGDTIVISDSSGEEDELAFSCPCCGENIKESVMNSHLDECLSLPLLQSESILIT